MILARRGRPADRPNNASTDASYHQNFASQALTGPEIFYCKTFCRCHARDAAQNQLDRPAVISFVEAFRISGASLEPHKLRSSLRKVWLPLHSSRFSYSMNQKKSSSDQGDARQVNASTDAEALNSMSGSNNHSRGTSGTSASSTSTMTSTSISEVTPEAEADPGRLVTTPSALAVSLAQRRARKVR